MDNYKNKHTLTLKEVLSALGFTYEKSKNYKNKVFDSSKVLLGDFTASECWDFLNEKGLKITTIQDLTGFKGFEAKLTK
jgi:hypothetical protein